MLRRNRGYLSPLHRQILYRRMELCEHLPGSWEDDRLVCGGPRAWQGLSLSRLICNGSAAQRHQLGLPLISTLAIVTVLLGVDLCRTYALQLPQRATSVRQRKRPCPSCQFCLKSPLQMPYMWDLEQCNVTELQLAVWIRPACMPILPFRVSDLCLDEKERATWALYFTIFFLARPSVSPWRAEVTTSIPVGFTWPLNDLCLFTAQFKTLTVMSVCRLLSPLPVFFLHR
jgi:hypothetical protein